MTEDTPAATPCINVCMIHPQARICTGCYRTIAEITAWSRLSEDERRRIMAELPTRAQVLAKG